MFDVLFLCIQRAFFYVISAVESGFF